MSHRIGFALLWIALVCAASTRAQQLPIDSQTVWVNLGGNDTTGDGSMSNPFASVGHAMASITDAGQHKLYTLLLGAGDYVETALALKPWVVVIGQHAASTSISVTGGTQMITLDASFAFGTTRGALILLSLADGTGLHFDLTATGSDPFPSATIVLQGVQIAGTVNVTGRSHCADTVTLYELSANDLVLDSLSIEVILSSIRGDLVIAASQCYSTGKLEYSTVLGTTTMTAANGTQGLPNEITFRHCSLAGAVSAQGEATMLWLDATVVNAPPVCTGGATYTIGLPAYTVAYTPADPAAWTSPPPTTIQEAIDRLAGSSRNNNAVVRDPEPAPVDQRRRRHHAVVG